MNENTPARLAVRWAEQAGQLLARANRLGPCSAGEVAAAEAGTLRKCAQELTDASIPQLDDPRITRPGPGYNFADRELLNITRLGLSRIYTAPDSEASGEMREAARQALARLEDPPVMPAGQRIVVTRTLEHGTLHHVSWSPVAGIWTADILYDGDARLTSVPLSKIEPEFTEGA